MNSQQVRNNKNSRTIALGQYSYFYFHDYPESSSCYFGKVIKLIHPFYNIKNSDS